MKQPSPLDKLRLNADRSAFLVDLALLMDRAGRLGLYRTMHKLHEAVREGGFEVADILTGKQQT